MGARPSSFVDDAPSSTPPETPTVHWSAQQVEIFNWFKNPDGSNLVVTARAGTGKTTTIVEGVRRAPEELSVVCAYNARIAKVLKERVEGSNACAFTLHSLGRQALQRKWRKIDVPEDSSDRARALTAAVCPKTIYDSTRRNISRLHTMAREMMPYCYDPAELVELALTHDLVQANERVEDICELAYAAMEKACEKSAIIDFADMLYLPLRLGLVSPRFDLVVVDEAQDMSPPQLDIAQLLVRPGGRICVVGDDRQAMYAFRGADSRALSRMKADLDARELFLTQTYRCGKTIVEVAQRWVPDIVTPAKAHDGGVIQVDSMTCVKNAQPGDFVLSRTNAPLVRLVMAYLRQGRRARIEGRDVGKQLLGLHKRFSRYGDVTHVEIWEDNMAQWSAREILRAEKNDLPRRVEQIEDTVATLRALADGANNTQEIEDRIAWLFDEEIDPAEFVVASTIHRAKGLEADKVWVLADTFLTHVACVCGHRHRKNNGEVEDCTKCGCGDYRPDPAQSLEEDNIRYVAVTRAINKLYWVTDRNVPAY